MNAVLLARLKLRIPEAKDGVLLDDILQEAEDYIKAYTMRSALPKHLNGIVLQLAVILYNRLGMEGETVHTEGGEQRTMEGLPKQIEDALRPYRLAKVGF